MSGVTSAIASQLYYPAANVIAGNPNGSITAVEFFGYNCEYCRKYFPIVEKFLQTHPDVRMVFKEYKVFGDETNTTGAYAALAANLQGQYLAMHNAMLSTTGVIKQADIVKLAQQLQLNSSRLLQDMQSATIHKQIDTNTALAKELGIDAAPTILFIKTKYALSPKLSAQVSPYIRVGNFSPSVLDHLYREATK